MISELMICNISDGSVQPVLEVDHIIKAPNWSPDGSHQIVNGNGQLFRVDLANPALEHIDTGNLDQLNNDHGVSPDGSQIVI